MRPFRKPSHSRILRAIVAVCLAFGSLVMVVQLDRAQDRVKDSALFSTNRAIWAMSELVFESQRFVVAIKDYQRGAASPEDLQTRFDILWSRIAALAWIEDIQAVEFIRAFRDYELYLQDVEPVIYGGAPLAEGDLAAIVENLEGLSIQARRAWIKTFAGADMTTRFLSTQDELRALYLYRFAILSLLVIIMVYVLAEIVFATHAQKREATLLQAARAASETKSRFLANVSHEIRTPLNGILGMASELAETPLSEDQASCVRVIEQSGGVLLSTINDVLDLSKIEAGKIHLELRPFDPRAVLETACALYSAAAREKGLSLDLRVQDNLPKMVSGDERRLRQVLHNLIANAVKFTECGGVTVRAKPGTGGAGIIISVQDTGPGVAAEARERIFQPFAQADTGIGRHYGGTGLGLSISRQLCEAMGGSLTLVTQLGSGSTFHCDLPLETVHIAAPAASEKNLETVPDLSDWSLLVVDDNATNRAILGRFLGPTRARISYAETGMDAIDMVADGAYDLVLMDIQMPGLSGIEAARRILENLGQGKRAAIPIVAVTANVLSHQVEEYIRAGMTDVLPKPVSKKTLMALLNRQIMLVRTGPKAATERSQG